MTDSAEFEVEKQFQRTMLFFIAIIIVNILAAVQKFLLQKIFSNTLNLTEFGNLAAIILLLNILTGMLSFGVGNSIIRFIKQEETPKNLIMTSIIVFSLIAIVLLVISPITYFLGFRILEISNYFLILNIILMITYLRLVIYVFRSLFIGQQTSIGLFGSNVFPRYTELLLALFFSWIFGFKILNILIGLLFADFITFSFLFISSIRFYGIGRFSQRILKDMIKFSGPSAIIIVIHRFFEFVIVFLLYYFVGPESVGIYAIALSIVGLLELVNVGVKTSIYPTVYRFYDTEEHRALRKFIPNWTKTYVAFILSASLSLLATSPILVVLTSNSSFLDAVEILPFLLLASALQIIESSVQIPYLLRKRVDLISIRQFIATVGAILLAFLLIPTFGLLGASITLSCHPFLRIILAYPLAQKLYHFDYPLYKFLLVGVNTLLALSGGYILWKIFLVRFEIAFLVPIPFFIAILFITRIITIREIKVYFRIIRSSKA